MKTLKGVAAVVCVVAIAWVTYGLFASSPKETDIEPAAGGEGAAPGQPMPIKVSTVASKEVDVWREFSGKLVAVDTVDIRPRVGGAIDKVYFEPGQIVEKDAPLFLIDPRPYQAETNRLAAALSVARTQAVLAKSESERAQRLIKENALSQREFDERQNAHRVAQANIQAADAALQQAKLNLIYATITSPIRGKISRAEITQGNLVDPAGAKILASVVSVDEIYADFDIDETTYVQNVRRNASADADHDIPVQLVLNTDDSVVYEGKVLAFDNKLDSSAGTIRARAIFTNTDQALIPGMFAKIRLGSAEKTQAILIPERVVSTDQDKKFVYVVNDKNIVTYRPVKLGASAEGMRMVEGLNPGDRIIVSALQRVRPDMPVQPIEVPLTAQEETDAPPSADKKDEAAAPQVSAEPETPAIVPQEPVAEEATPEVPAETSSAPEVSQEALPDGSARDVTAEQPQAMPPSEDPATNASQE